MDENRGGKWMIRKYTSRVPGGEPVIEKSKFWVPAQARPRGKKKNASSKRKQDENGNAAVRELARLINCNYTHGDLWLALTYSDEGYASLGGGDIDEIKKAADKQLTLFLRRMGRHCKKAGIDFKYIAMTSDMDGDTGELTRPHHHVLMPRVAYELAAELWSMGSVDYQLLRKQTDYTPLAVYLCKQCRREINEHRWHATRNLRRPEVEETETHQKGELRAPGGAVVKQIGAYDEESGNHYIRYVAPKRQKRGGHKEGTEQPKEVTA